MPSNKTALLDSFQKPIQYIKGVGPKRAVLFKKLNIETIHDALFFLPRRYEDRSCLRSIAELVPGEQQTFVAEIVLKNVSRARRRKKAIRSCL